MNRCYETLSWALKQMPTGKAQAALTAKYNQLPQNSETAEDDIIIMLSSAVLDGLMYGNWPGHTAEECFKLARIRAARLIAKGE